MNSLDERACGARSPQMRRFLALSLLFVALVPTYSGPNLRPFLGREARFEAEPVLLFEGEPERRRVDALTFLAGWELTSEDPAFGSISAMRLRDGAFTAISDTGGVIRFRIANGAPRPLSFGDLAEGPGRGIEKLDRDAESVAIDPANGTTWVGFERMNAIWRYTAAFGAAGHAEPEAMSDWPENGGAEAMVRLRSGRFLVFSEAGDGPGRSRAALLFAGDPVQPGAKPLRFGYSMPGGYRITDAAELPDGRILLLARRIGWLIDISAKLAVLDPRMIRAGEAIRPRVIATLARPMTVDNMEALAVDEENGRTILWIASDDNFSPFQRTLLMKFALDEGDQPG